MTTTGTEDERYSYGELKQAQQRCVQKAVDAVLSDCEGSISSAQREIFQAHVNDLCASIFCGVMRQYDPHTREDMEPVDASLLEQVDALEKQLKEKEAEVREHREKVPKLVAEQTRQSLQAERKRTIDGLVKKQKPTVAIETQSVDIPVDQIKQQFETIRGAISQATTKLSQVMAQTTETIGVVERAMKRPKTAIDLAMEKSPAKVILPTENQHEDGSASNPVALRCKLARHFTSITTMR